MTIQWKLGEIKFFALCVIIIALHQTGGQAPEMSPPCYIKMNNVIFASHDNRAGGPFFGVCDRLLCGRTSIKVDLHFLLCLFAVKIAPYAPLYEINPWGQRSYGYPLVCFNKKVITLTQAFSNPQLR